MGTSTGFAIFRAPVFPPFGVQGLHLCGLRFFFFSGSGFCISQYPRCVSFQALLFLFCGLRFLHFSAPEVCIFSGSAFSIFRCLGFACLWAPVFFFSGSGFCISRYPRCASFWAPVFALSGTRGVHFFGLWFFYFSVVIVTGNPGVFQGYLYPYPSKPVPTTKGRGFDGSG